jgi:hypothetical protein
MNVLLELKIVTPQIFVTLLSMSPGSSAGTATGYGMDGPEIEVINWRNNSLYDLQCISLTKIMCAAP